MKKVDCYYYDEEINCCGALSDYSKMPCGLVPCTDDKCGMKEPRQSFECTAKNCPLEFGKTKRCTVHCCEYRTKPTNFDKITSSVESLAEFIDSLNLIDCSACVGRSLCDCHIRDCKFVFKLWLEQESKE
jgi:hypothetical protein